MIRGIIFDCFGVLYGGSLTYLASLAPENRRKEVYDINSAKDYGYITDAECRAQIGEIIGKSADEVADIIMQKHLPNEALFDYIPQLKDTYKIGLLSNIGDHMFDTLFDEKRRQLFDEVMLSYQEGIAKPNPVIFTMMAERMGLAPDECVMIDDLESNCDGAEIAGMHSIQHTTNDVTQGLLDDLLSTELPAQKNS